MLAEPMSAKLFEVDRSPLTSVTVVFVAVANADVLVRQKPVVAEAVHYALGSVMQVCCHLAAKCVGQECIGQVLDCLSCDLDSAMLQGRRI